MNQTISLDGHNYRVAYKVVTPELKSLGLRGNPTIFTYPENKWFTLPVEKIIFGDADEGGIWAAVDRANARGYLRYMRNKHGIECRAYKAAIGRILYETSCRVKTDRIFLAEEITDLLCAHHLSKI